MSKIKSIREIEMEREAQPNFGKGITVASGFDLGAKAPLDSRATVKTIEERDAHLTGNRAYEGMLVYVEADKKTYQLVDGRWKIFGFDNEQFESNVEDTLESDSQTTALSAKQGKVLKGMIDAQSNQLSAVDGKVEANTQSITQLDTKVTTEIERAKEQEAAIRQEVTAGIADAKGYTGVVEGKITAEISRATAAEEALGNRIGGVEASVGEVRGLVDTKTAQTLTDAKAYTDEKVAEINAANEALKTKVEANEAALGLVDGKIAAAKSEAINTSNAHTTSEIAKIDAAYKAADVQTLESAKSYADTKIGEAKAALEGSIATVDGKVTALTSKVSANESAIANLRDAISNKNSNTIVVNTEDEIATANPNPKVGDIAYVISSKRAYIFKGVDAAKAIVGEAVVGNATVTDEAMLRAMAQGWVVFDEITSELDLVDYLKKSEAEATYRKLSAKIAEADLATELVNNIDAKADKSYVDGELAKKTTEAYVNTKVEEVVAPVRTESAQNKAAIAKEVQDRTAEITRVDGLIDALEAAVEKANQLTAELQAKLTKLEEVEENRIVFED